MAKILIVDDHAGNREFLLALLSHQHQLLEAADGEEALARTRAERPDLVITDLLMPKMDGYEFLRRLRNDPAVSATRVIFYSAKYHRWEVDELIETGRVAQHLEKPSQPEEILRAVNQALVIPSAPGPLAEPEQYDRAHLRVISDKLARKVEDLDALCRLGQEMALETDSGLLLERFCRAAREVIRSRYATIAVISEDGQSLRHFILSGLDAEAARRIGQPPLERALLRSLMPGKRPRRWKDLLDEESAAFPESYPPVRSLLWVPIDSPSRHYGALYFTDTLEGEEFTKENEQLAAALGLQLGIAYENARRLEELERAREELRQHAQSLEQRIQERTATLQAVVAELKDFSHSITQDLRSPLTAIRGFAEALLQESQDSPNPTRQNLIHQIERAVQHIENLLRDALDRSRSALPTVQAEGGGTQERRNGGMSG